MNLPDHLSASSINTFFQCPYKKFCDYKKRQKIPTDRKSADFGVAVHSVIPSYYGDIDDFPSRVDMLDAIEVAFSEGGNYATTSMKTKYSRVKNHFIRYEERRIREKRRKPTIVEKVFTSKIFEDLPPFQWKLDAYFSDVKMLVDWKTGNNVQMDDELVLQGLLYKLGLIKEGHEVDKVIFVDLTKGNEPPMPMITSGFLYSKARQMCDMIVNDRFPSKESYLCNYCEYKLSCELRYYCPWVI